MKILPNKTYKLLKSLSKQSMTLETISKKYGKSAEIRLDELIERGFVDDKNHDPFGEYGNEEYEATDKGISYLEDHSSYIRREALAGMKKGIFYPVFVSIIVSIIVNYLIHTLILGI